MYKTERIFFFFYCNDYIHVQIQKGNKAKVFTVILPPQPWLEAQIPTDIFNEYAFYVFRRNILNHMQSVRQESDDSSEDAMCWIRLIKHKNCSRSSLTHIISEDKGNDMILIKMTRTLKM